MRGRLSQGRIRVQIPSITRLVMGATEYLWVIFVILNGNSVYHANAIRNLYFLEIILILTFLLVVMNLMFYRKWPMKRSLIGAVAILCYCTIYFSLMQEKMPSKNYLELFIVGAPLTFLLFSEYYRNGRLMRLLIRFADVVFLLAVISLYFWFMGEVFKLIEPNGYVEMAWGGQTIAKGYYRIHFAFQLDTTFFPDAFLFRNSGIFSEAPMFNLWLDLAVAIELFIRPKASKLRLIVLAVTVFTTLSVTGILFLVLCVGLKAFAHMHSLNKWQTCLLIILAMVVIPLLSVLVIRSMSMKMDTVSYEMRLSDYGGGVRLWMDHPLLGAGYGSLTALLPYIYSPDGVLGFSNSVTAVLGTGGLWMALLFYIPLIAMLFPRLSGSRKLSAFGCCYLYLFCTTAFFSRFLAPMMVALGYAVLSGVSYQKNEMKKLGSTEDQEEKR